MSDADQSRPVRDAKGRILLVDDEDAIRKVAARMLRHSGYEVETAKDGQEAVEMVRANPERCDVVVLDGNMPRMSGSDAARLIREIRADLPLILATGYFDANGVNMPSRVVFNGVIEKPYDMASLSKVVSAHLRRPD